MTEVIEATSTTLEIYKSYLCLLSLLSSCCNHDISIELEIPFHNYHEGVIYRHRYQPFLYELNDCYSNVLLFQVWREIEYIF